MTALLNTSFLLALASVKHSVRLLCLKHVN
jgi:hypothetical protein